MFVRETESNEFNTCKYIIYGKRNTTQHKEKFARNIAKCHKISLQVMQIPAKYRKRLLKNYSRLDQTWP